MAHIKITLLLLVSCYCFFGCAKENEPNNPAPELTIDEAQGITRTSAEISGTVKIPTGSLTDTYHFRYGLTQQMEQSAEGALEKEKLTARLENLLPGTTYYYCLEAGNKSQLVQSKVLQFSTMPNEVPQLEKTIFCGQGPISITLQCAIRDTGGEAIIKTGFVHTDEDGKEQENTTSLSEGDKWYLRIGQLKENSNYTVRAFAENKIGRTYSEPYHFRTGQAVILATAGTLPDIMDENEKYGYSELSIAGPLNGTDIRFIREMLGKDIYGNKTMGKLTQLDLTDASIVAGGLSYNETRYTEDDVIGYSMFGELDILESLKIPEGTQTIMQDAFKNSVNLTTITIPEKTSSLLPSSGCSKLNHISVSLANRMFSSLDGVVYNQSGEILIWFPEGISGDEIKLSPTLKSLGDFAMQKCRVRSIVLPPSLTKLGKQVFYGAEIESIILPDGIQTITYGLFQNCSKLTSVTIGSHCNLISDYCFDGCTLEHLSIKSTQPPVCSPNAFVGALNLFSECTLHVPTESVDLYRKGNKVWAQFLKVSPATF